VPAVHATPQALLDQADAAHRALSGVSHPSWTWSAPTAPGCGPQGTAPAVEADGAQLRATNVVVLRVDVVNTAARESGGQPGAGDAAGRHRGTGTGRHRGRTLAGTWSKASVTDPVVLTGPDGAVTTG
jgi:hypothetical protein